MTKSLIIFCHIEKCAGTTLVDKFRRDFAFQSADFLANSNFPTASEISQLMWVYPKLRLISGHSLYPITRSLFESKFDQVKMFTVVRDPIGRLISNYFHDKRRGVWEKNLDAYARIPWKQNYILRFLGAGDPEMGQIGYDSLDAVIDVKDVDTLLPEFFERWGCSMVGSLPKRNQASEDISSYPDDLREENGEKIGRYSIKTETVRLIKNLNAEDIKFYNTFMSKNGTPNLQQNSGALAKKQNTKTSLRRMASIYRNAVYKPLVLKKLGHHALPRNATSPDKVDERNAFK